MATNRKLGKTTDKRLAMLKSQTTDLILHGKIETTEARAKEVKAIVDSIIALAIKEKDNFETVDVKVVKAKLDDKGNKVKLSIYESFNPEAADRLEVKGNKSNFSFTGVKSQTFVGSKFNNI